MFQSDSHGGIIITCRCDGFAQVLIGPGFIISLGLLVSHIPVDMGNFIINFGVMMKKDPNISAAGNKAMVEEYTEKNIESFHQDVAIWNNKCIIDNPLMCDGDGPVHLVRKWYSQFMTDLTDIREDQVRAREHVAMEGPTVKEVIASMS